MCDFDGFECFPNVIFCRSHTNDAWMCFAKTNDLQSITVRLWYACSANGCQPILSSGFSRYSHPYISIFSHRHFFISFCLRQMSRNYNLRWMGPLISLTQLHVTTTLLMISYRISYHISSNLRPILPKYSLLLFYFHSSGMPSRACSKGIKIKQKHE